MPSEGSSSATTAPASPSRSDATGPTHLPTSRVPFELVLWHLIAEWGVRAKTDAWQHRLRDSLAGFEERRPAP
jgi:hypothetical protein